MQHCEVVSATTSQWRGSNKRCVIYRIVSRDDDTTTDEHQRHHLGSNCYYTMPGLCSTDTVEFFRIVRLVYIKPTTSVVSDFSTEMPPLIYPVSYETFIPDLIQRQETASPSQILSSSAALNVDPMKDTFDKVVAFLHYSGIYALIPI